MVTNLVPNGGFEINATGWASVNGANTIVRDTTMANYGIASLKVTTSATNYNGAEYALQAVSPSTNYTSSCFIKGTAGNTITWASAEWTAVAAGSYILGNNITQVLTGGWDLFVWSGATSGTTNAFKANVQTGNPGAIQTVWLDSVQLETGLVRTPFIETPGPANFLIPGWSHNRLLPQ